MTYYDAQVEYLESTGTQYINTLTTYNSDTDSLELEYAYTNRTISGDNIIIGVKGDTNRLIINTYYSPTLYIGFGNVANRVNLADTSKTYIVVKNKKCFSKNTNDELVTIADWSSQGTFTTNIIYLFADNYIDSVKYQHKGIRIKRFKIDNKIDLIPVRIGSVGYMYDKVSDRLFGNAGTGSFTLGPDVKVTSPIGGKPKVSSIRRQMIQLMPKHDSKYQYIQDGLIFQLDGINKGNDSTKWIDLIGGNYFTLNDHSILHDDCIEMDGAGYINSNFSNLGVLATNGTIEVCFNNYKNSGVLFIQTKSTELGLLIWNSGFAYKPLGNNKNEYKINPLGIFSASMSESLAVVNGNIITNRANNKWDQNSSRSTIGGRDRGTAYYYKGKIYAIRIYNRKLTEDEMLHNQQVDNIRFNLGLGL